eukprot:COSAG03_NODE_2291_length_2912_cov_1.283327_1_plen_158_part_00
MCVTCWLDCLCARSHCAWLVGACADTYFGKFVFACLLMPTLLLSVYIVYRKQSSTEDILDRSIKMAFTVIFLVFPFVCQTMFAVGPANSRCLWLVNQTDFATHAVCRALGASTWPRRSSGSQPTCRSAVSQPSTTHSFCLGRLVCSPIQLACQRLHS